MDRVRFGRALGYGARHAVKTLAEAAKAASAPASDGRSTAHLPQRPAPPGGPLPRAGSGTVAGVHAGTSPSVSIAQEAASQVVDAQRAVTQARDRARAGAVHAGKSMLAPVRRAGGVLWLEMTGCAFSLFALFLASGLWKLRSAVHASPSSHEAQKFYLYLVVLVLFTYFAVTSFVRAHRRGQRP